MDVTVARIAAEHIDGFHSAFDFVARERKYLARFEAPPLERTREFVSNNIAKGYPQYVALAGDKVVGWCDVTPKQHAAYAHSGVLGMGLLPEWRGRGNGAGLLAATLEDARRFGFVRIELVVYADNSKAIALYERAGFRREGVMQDAAFIDGEYRDNIIMAIVERGNARAMKITG